jgi:UDP-N-acetylglucosamine acyltransferase
VTVATPLIHPTAIIDPEAKLGEGTRVGAFSVIEGPVHIGRDCEIQQHVVIRGHVRLGDRVRVFPGAVIGGEPQHLKYKGEATSVEIGDRVTLREGVTVNRGTSFGLGTTRVGSDSFIMAYAHIAHDCIVGKSVILANGTLLAGHAEVGDFVTMGGLCGAAQFCRVGAYSYVGGGTMIRKDLAPYLLAKGNEIEVAGINAVGLSRQGFSPDSLRRLKSLYKLFFVEGITVSQAIERATVELAGFEEVRFFLDFVKGSKMGIHR